MKNHPRFASRRGVGTVSCSRQQLSHASDSQGPQPPSGAQTLIRSIRGSSPGLTGGLTLRPSSIPSEGPHCPPFPGSHRGSHTRTLIHSVMGSSLGLSWVSPGVSYSDPHLFHQGVLTWPLPVSLGVSELGPHPFHQGVLTWPLLGLTGGLTLRPSSVPSGGPHLASPGSHRGSHSSDPHPFHQGVLTALPSPVSLGVSLPGSWCCPRPCTKPDVTREGPL